MENKKFQKIKNINEGQYSSKLITHDIVTKKIRQHDYSLAEEWLDTEHLNEAPPINFKTMPKWAGSTRNTNFAPYFDSKGPITSGSRVSQFPDSLVMFAPKHDKMYAQNFGHEHDNKVEEWKLRRAGQMVQYDGIVMEVECSGLSFIRVGMTVTLNVLSPETTSTGKHDIAFDKFLSGTYMITGIRHMFNSDKGNVSYKMILELSKDGLDSVAMSRIPREQGNK